MVASVSYNTSGSAGPYTITFDYLEEADVDVYLDGVANTAFTISSTQLTLNTAPAANSVIEIRRATNNTPYVDFTAPAPLIPSDLDTAYLQALYIAQEAVDKVSLALKLNETGVAGGIGIYWDADSKQIKDVDDPTAAQDVATKAYVDAISVAAGNVPTPDDPADDDKVLTASGGAYDWVALASGAILGVNVFTGTQSWDKGADIASNTALALGVDGNLFDVTGTTTITSISSKGVGTIIVLQFDDAVLLTHHAVDLVLRSGVNVTTATGDVFGFASVGDGEWIEIFRTRPLSATEISVGTVPTARLGSGTANTGTYLRGDSSWQAISGGLQPVFVLDPESASFPAANFPQLKKAVGTNWVGYSLGFDKDTDEAAYWKFKIPTTAVFTAATIKIVSRQLAATTANAAWQVTTITRADGEAYDTAGTTDDVAAAAVKGTAGMLLFQSVALTVTGWAAGEMLYVKLNRDVSADDVAEDVEFVCAEIELS